MSCALEIGNNNDNKCIFLFACLFDSSPGPNSPIDWVQECIKNLVPDYSRDLSLKRAKILVGLNFYGMLYAEDRSGSKPILGHE